MSPPAKVFLVLTVIASACFAMAAGAATPSASESPPPVAIYSKASPSPDGHKDPTAAETCRRNVEVALPRG